jgi:hypothetical protein
MSLLGLQNRRRNMIWLYFKCFRKATCILLLKQGYMQNQTHSHFSLKYSMDWDIELDPLLERNMHQLQDSNAMPHPSHLEAEAFKRLYPDQYLAKFLEQSG